MLSHRCNRYRYVGLALSAILVVLITLIPIRLAIAFYLSPRPTAILTLGGGPEREQFTAQFAVKYPSLPIWISSGSPPEYTRRLFQAANVPEERLHLDYNAIDTVTNFTTTVEHFKELNIHHLYLITSDFHMRRAKAIATLVLGSQGITFTPIPITSNYPHRETWWRVARDCLRSVLWIFSDRTGASLNPRSKQTYPNLPSQD